MEKRNGIKVFVSSTVYDFETDLDKIYALLDGYGYEVYLSKNGTIPLDSKLSNINNCLMGVDDCDVFVGFIRPVYGSGVMEDGISITERGFIKAYEKNVPRFILADTRVVFTRRLLKWMNLDPSAIPNEKTEHCVTKQNMVVDGRCVSMYNKSVKDGEFPVSSRIGNWVQEYANWDQIRIHLEAQFKDVERIKKLIDNDGK